MLHIVLCVYLLVKYIVLCIIISKNTRGGSYSKKERSSLCCISLSTNYSLKRVCVYNIILWYKKTVYVCSILTLSIIYSAALSNSWYWCLSPARDESDDVWSYLSLVCIYLSRVIDSTVNYITTLYNYYVGPLVTTYHIVIVYLSNDSFRVSIFL